MFDGISFPIDCMAHLADIFDDSGIFRDAEFSTLGYVDSNTPGTLVFADGIKYVRKATGNKCVSCIVTTSEFAGEAEGIPGIVCVDNPRSHFYRVHKHWIDNALYQFPFNEYRGENCKIHSSAIVESGSYIGDNVTIGEHVVVKNCAFIDSGVTIEPGVKIGVDGILYDQTSDGPRMLRHGGFLKIGRDTALMTNSVVVRSVHDSFETLVGDSCIVGLGAIVGHEARVGNRVVISNQCVLARRCQIGDGAFVGTGSFIREHVTVGEKAKVMSGSIVIDHVADESQVSGNFATNHQRRLMEFATNSRVPEL